jgi:hypothetical protein
LLKSEGWDEQRLGLEPLCILTDLHKVVDADKASPLILTDSHYSDLLEQYFVHAQMHRNHTNTHASTTGTTTNMDYERLLGVKSGFLWTWTVCFGVTFMKAWSMPTIMKNSTIVCWNEKRNNGYSGL